MKLRYLGVGSVFSVLILAIACCSRTVEQTTADEPAKNGLAAKWEYKVVVYERFLRAFDGTPVENVQKHLNTLGRDGWEVCGVIFEGDPTYMSVYTLKRRSP
jgi:hypothetical protein